MYLRFFSETAGSVKRCGRRRESSLMGRHVLLFPFGRMGRKSSPTRRWNGRNLRFFFTIYMRGKRRISDMGVGRGAPSCRLRRLAACFAPIPVRRTGLSENESPYVCIRTASAPYGMQEKIFPAPFPLSCPYASRERRSSCAMRERFSQDGGVAVYAVGRLLGAD